MVVNSPIPQPIATYAPLITSILFASSGTEKNRATTQFQTLEFAKKPRHPVSRNEDLAELTAQILVPLRDRSLHSAL